MIALLTGTLIFKAPDRCVIDVGGVGYSVSVSLTTFASLPDIGSAAKLSIHTHVREDQLHLYGFTTEDEKALFQRLIAVSGIGPKTALTMLSGIPVGDLVEAISTEDRGRLSTIPGVGKKTAERIIVELKDRILRDAILKSSMPATGRGRLFEDALSALMNLGYQRAVAEGALKKGGWSDKMTIEESIRLALKELCRA